MAKKSCKKGYYYCFTSKKCKKIPSGWHVMPSTGYLMRDSEHKDEKEETKKKNGNGANGNGDGNGDSSGSSDGGGVSEGWSAKYKRSIDCDNPKGFSQRAHCQGRKKVTEATMSPAQKRKDTMLKKKYDKSDMKQNMIDQYGKEEGTKIYFATIRKQAMKEEKKGDHEVAMAQSQLKKSEENIKKLRKALGKKEKDIPAWMQAKITDTAHDTDAAAGYVDKMDEEVIAEKRDGKSAKDKGYSLRDWFRGGGWKQTGGKYDGKPCARQPGQKTKPFCRDADDRANMSKDERKRRFAKKNAEDPNPNRKGKAKMVSASYSNWRADLEQLDEIAPLAAGALVAGLAAAPYLAKKFLKPKADKALQRGRNELHLKGNPIGAGARGLGERYDEIRPYDRIKMGDGKLRSIKDIDSKLKDKKPVQKNSFELEGDLVDEGLPNPKVNYLKDMDPYDTRRQIRQLAPGSPLPPADTRPGLPDMRLKKAKAKTDKKVQTASYEMEGDLVDEGKKDACYHKVKSRYSVWPSAYASGALVKCRKVGAKNWGNKTKKESYEFSNWRDDFQATEYESVDIIKAEPLQPTQGIGSDMLDEKKRLMNKLDKISGQLRKASAMHKKQSQEVAKVSQHLCAKEVKHEEFGYGETIFGEHAVPDENGFVSHYNIQFKHGIVENVSVKDVEVLTLTEHENHEMSGDVISEGGKKCWKGYKKAGTQKLFGKTYNRCVKAHFSDWRADMDLQEKKAKKDYDGDGKIESGSEEYLGSRDKAIKKAMGKKKNCGCGKDPCETYGKQEVKEDWQKSNRNDGVDGMSQKSVNAYKRENPGSKLQTAVTEKKPTGKRAKRRTSFCARSKGQKDMHNIDCTKTPDKRICKARKRWRC